MLSGLCRAACACAIMSAVAGPAGAASPALLSAHMGAYLQNPGLPNTPDRVSFDSHLQQFAGAMNAAPQFLDTYIDDTQLQSSWAQNAGWLATCLQTSSAAGMTQVVGVPLFSTNNGIGANPDPQLQAMAAGSYDQALIGIVDALATSRTAGFAGFKTLYFRLGWEMNLNGRWFAGQNAQTAADWVLAFQHAAAVLRQEAIADNAQALIVWNPGTVVWGVQNVTQVFYPGDAYVDVIAADFYADMYPVTNGTTPTTWENWDTRTSPTGQPWPDTNFLDIIDDGVNRAHYWSYPSADEWSPQGDQLGFTTSFMTLLKFAHARHKPFGVAEAGAGGVAPYADVSDDGTFPVWLGTHLARAAASGTTIAFVNLWDSNGTAPYMFSDGSKPQELAAFRSWFGGN